MSRKEARALRDLCRCGWQRAESSYCESTIGLRWFENHDGGSWLCGFHSRLVEENPNLVRRGSIWERISKKEVEG